MFLSTLGGGVTGRGMMGGAVLRSSSLLYELYPTGAFYSMKQDIIYLKKNQGPLLTHTPCDHMWSNSIDSNELGWRETLHRRRPNSTR